MEEAEGLCVTPHRPEGSVQLLDVQPTMPVPFLDAQPTGTQKCAEQSGSVPPQGQCALLKFLRAHGERAE